MSDALTDIARDERRAREFGKLARAMLAYVREQTQESFNAAVSAAEDVDSVPRGYWGNRTSLAESILDALARLRAGDEKEWARWLADVSDSYGLYDEFLEASPFAGKVLLVRRYRSVLDVGLDTWSYKNKIDLGDVSVLVFDPPQVVVLKERR